MRGEAGQPAGGWAGGRPAEAELPDDRDLFNRLVETRQRLQSAGPLGTQGAAVDRMIRVAFDADGLAVDQANENAAANGTIRADRAVERFHAEGVIKEERQRVDGDTAWSGGRQGVLARQQSLRRRSV
jgi:hypothetical protein